MTASPTPESRTPDPGDAAACSEYDEALDEFLAGLEALGDPPTGGGEPFIRWSNDVAILGQDLEESVRTASTQAVDPDLQDALETSAELSGGVLFEVLGIEDEDEPRFLDQNFLVISACMSADAPIS